MQSRRRKLYCIIILIILLLGIIIMHYLNNDNGFQKPYYAISDNKYLGDSITQTDKFTEERLKDLAIDLINTSIENNGQNIPMKFKNIISSELFQKIDIGVDYNDQLYNENFNLNNIEVKYNENKAIINYEFQYNIISKEDNSIFCSYVVTNEYPCKLYLEMYNGDWKVVDVFISN